MATCRIAHGHEAGGGAAVHHPVADQLSDQHRTGTTITLAAADLGSGAMTLVPDEIEQRITRGQGRGNLFVIQDELQQAFNIFTDLKI
jgi:hypothetical protein